MASAPPLLKVLTSVQNFCVPWTISTSLVTKLNFVNKYPTASGAEHWQKAGRGGGGTQKKIGQKEIRDRDPVRFAGEALHRNGV